MVVEPSGKRPLRLVAAILLVVGLLTATTVEASAAKNAKLSCTNLSWDCLPTK